MPQTPTTGWFFGCSAHSGVGFWLYSSHHPITSIPHYIHCFPNWGLSFGIPTPDPIFFDDETKPQMVGDWDGLLGLSHCSHWTIGNDIIAIQWYYIMFFLSIAIRYPWYGGWLRNPAPVGRWAKSHESGPPFPGKTLASFSWWTTTTWPSFPVMDGWLLEVDRTQGYSEYSSIST